MITYVCKYAAEQGIAEEEALKKELEMRSSTMSRGHFIYISFIK